MRIPFTCQSTPPDRLVPGATGLFRVSLFLSILFCWGVVMMLPEWGHRAPIDEESYRIPVRGFGDRFVGPWLGFAFYASAAYIVVCLPISLIVELVGTLLRARNGDRSPATDTPECPERLP